MSSCAADRQDLLHHGGGLRKAAASYGIPLCDWLDLSTGINPHGWPVPPVPPSVWARLPEAEDGLVAAARDYYGSAHVLPVAGSQAAIQALPRLRPRSQVAVLDPGYAEHAAAWRRAGHAVTPVSQAALADVAARADVLVLIHPNNPTGTRLPLDRLLDWRAQLAARGGWLVVDEAFADATPDLSVAPRAGLPGLIVLRSLGKFFGLAGLRLGFVCAQPALLRRLEVLLGPWAVNGPARWVAGRALCDRAWQAGARARLAKDEARLLALLTRHGLTPDGGCALFQWARTPQAGAIHDRLARQGILTRLFDRPPALRLGLPGSDAEWARLDEALASLSTRRGQEGAA